MFEPQPTPFTSCFASYGVALELDSGFPMPAGGGGAGTPAGPRYGLQQDQEIASLSPAASSTYALSTTSTTSPPPLIPSNRDTAQAHHQQCQTQQYQQQHQHQQPSHRYHIPQQQHHQPRQAPPQPYPSSVIILKMEGQQGQHGMAAQQAAAKDYQVAPPQTYSHYRPIRGDGNCGWRAIGFSYFEKLIDSGDQGKIEGEVARLMSFGQMITNVGGYPYFEEWADEMFALLREISRSMDNPQAAHLLLLERWNDAALTGSIIYYLRLLAATYLKANAVTYDPFLPEVAGGVHGYCAQSIELVGREIEHLGIVALVNVLLQPVGFVLEIAYLDRSPGGQANRYRFPEEANGRDPASLGPIIYLLDRPDHYDILYLTPTPLPVPAPVSTAPVSMQVNRVNSFSHNTQITGTQTKFGEYTSVDVSALSIIPGFNSMGGMTPLAPPPPSPSTAGSFSPASVQSPWMPQYSDMLPASTPQPRPSPAIMTSPQPPSPPTSMAGSSSMGPNPVMVATSGLRPQTSLMPRLRTTPGCHIRFSPVQLEYEECKNSIEPHLNVKTNTFKNSIWNRAHYGNSDFHPEEWSPDDEHADGRGGGKRKFKKESA
ncbi:peptidase C65 Otubain-domain-containing protein [Dactylonectria macrodidyma]|uniref:ubiquitinyl hydrolase 1 n=1 Tax=Dactylonectria macrodidyma TaxID=307937 RepID=A0A9P9IAA6_9HYPO|nr:peptidase C65 Otubain-domain-containing protein [Dactylonectria macrodidyma]